MSRRPIPSRRPATAYVAVAAVIAAVAVIGWLTARMLPRYRVLGGIGANVLGVIVVLYVFGIVGMMVRGQMTLWGALGSNVSYLPGDLLKAVVAAVVAAQVHRAYPGLIAPRTAVRPTGDLAH